jgi:hypothetical protein
MSNRIFSLSWNPNPPRQNCRRATASRTRVSSPWYWEVPAVNDYFCLRLSVYIIPLVCFVFIVVVYINIFDRTPLCQAIY